MKCCHKCGAEWVSAKKQPGVKEYCESCTAWLHCCLNCRYHEPAAHNQCYIPNTDWVGDRAGPNFCDEFEFREKGSEKESGEKTDARQKLDALFGDSNQQKPATLDDLFS